MEKARSVVFGASGPTGKAVCRCLLARTTDDVVAVSRSGRIQALESTSRDARLEVRSGDCLNAGKCKVLCESAHAVFCCVGLPYDSDRWDRDFPIIIDNLLQATPRDATFVFADNLYMFGEEAAMTGQPLQPNMPFTRIGRKPQLRARLDQAVLQAHRNGKCRTVIVRAADFFGPGVTLATATGEMVIGNMCRGKSPQIPVPIDRLHTFTFNPDFAVALVCAAMQPSAWGKAYHCPNAPPLSVRDFLRRVSEHLNGGSKAPAVITGWKRSVLGWFIKPLREIEEMDFEWNRDFLVDHQKFTDAFPDSGLPTPLDAAIEETVKWYQSLKK